MDLLLEFDLIQLNKTLYFLKNVDSEGKCGWTLQRECFVSQINLFSIFFFFSCGFHPSCWDSCCAVSHYCVHASQKMKLGGNYFLRPNKIPGPQREGSLLLPGICAQHLCIFIKAGMLHIHMDKLWLLWELSWLSTVS